MSGYSKVTDSSVKSRLKAIGVSISSTPVSLRRVVSFIAHLLPGRALAPRHHSVPVQRLVRQRKCYRRGSPIVGFETRSKLPELLFNNLLSNGAKHLHFERVVTG